jgi:hypothetical protein
MRVLAGIAILCIGVPCAAATVEEDPRGRDQGPVVVDGRVFGSRALYLSSHYFYTSGKRCGLSSHEEWLKNARANGLLPEPRAAFTKREKAFNPGDVLQIPVVVHIITASDGTTGDLTNSIVQSQIDILNEDFRALAGTNGAPGTDTMIQFVLADRDPSDNPSSGITRTANDTWFADSDEDGFKTALVWDPDRYLNIYTNNTAYLGYAYSPEGSAGQYWDGVVITYTAFGRNSPFPPYDQGRTATHEIGHYVGLYHVFEPWADPAEPNPVGEGCPSGVPDCYSDNGDLICDTNPEAYETYGCPVGQETCGSLDNIRNYLDYTNDTCMWEFTPEQTDRMRNQIAIYRSTLVTVASDIFTDGFESGNTSVWSSTLP